MFAQPRTIALLFAALAVFVACHVAVAGATPTYKTCAKAIVKGTGAFNDASCSVPSLGGKGEGKYELGAWDQGKKRTFKGKSSVAKLAGYIPESQEMFWTGGTSTGGVQCKLVTVAGEVTGPSTSTEAATFKGCISEGKKCTTPGEKPGTIVTSQLTGVLGSIENGVGMLLEAGGEGTGASSVFNCEGIQVTISGSVIGGVSGNVGQFGKETTLTFAVTEKNGQQVVFGEFPEESEAVFGPGTGAVHVLRAVVTPPGVQLPSTQSYSVVLKGETMEIQP